MKVEIRIGDVTSNNIIQYPIEKLDDVEDEKIRMYEFLSNNKNCIICDVDLFLLYTINNGIMAFIVKDNYKKTKKEDEDYLKITKFDPDYYRVFEVLENGNDVSLQDENGNIHKNYFNQLMGNVMDDYYDCLTYYGA